MMGIEDQNNHKVPLKLIKHIDASKEGALTCRVDISRGLRKAQGRIQKQVQSKGVSKFRTTTASTSPLVQNRHEIKPASHLKDR